MSSVNCKREVLSCLCKKIHVDKFITEVTYFEFYLLVNFILKIQVLFEKLNLQNTLLLFLHYCDSKRLTLNFFSASRIEFLIKYM